MARYLSKTRANLDKLSEWVAKRVPQAENIQADALAGIVATLLIKEAVLLPLYHQVASSIATTPVCSANETSGN